MACSLVSIALSSLTRTLYFLRVFTHNFIQGKNCLPKPFTVNALLKVINQVALRAKTEPAPATKT